MKHILILTLLLVSQLMFAQDVTAVWSDKEEEAIAVAEDGTLIMDPWEPIKKRANELGITESWYGGRYIFNTPNHNYVALHNHNKKTNTMDTYFFEVDKSGIKGEPKLACSFPYSKKLMVMPGQINNQIGADGLHQSTDKKMFAHISVSSAVAVKGPRKVFIGVFDENLNTLWQKEQEFPFNNTESDFNEATVTNDGKVVLACKTLRKDKIDWVKELDFHSSLWVISKDEAKETKLELGNGAYPVKFLMQQQDSLNVLWAGFYVDNPKGETILGGALASQTSGIFTINLNTATVTLSGKHLSEYKAETILKILSIHDKNPKPTRWVNFETRNWVQSFQGQGLDREVVREMLYIDDIFKSAKGERLLIAHRYGCLIAFGLSNDGKVISEIVVPTGKEGVYPFTDGQKVYFIYPYMTSKPTAVTTDKEVHVNKLGSIDFSGNSFTEKVFSKHPKHREGDYVIPARCRQIDSHHVTIVSYPGHQKGVLTVK